MNIYHHHSIHLCSTCSARPDDQHQSSRPRPSFLRMFASALELMVMAFADRVIAANGTRSTDEDDTVAHGDPGTPEVDDASPQRVSAIVAHSSQGAGRAPSPNPGVTGAAEELKTPAPSLAGAFLSALRGGLTLA